jgi:hypothetical protein
MDKESIHMTEHVQHDPTSFHPLGKHDLDKAEERHGVFDHSDGRLVVDPEEAKLEVRLASVWLIIQTANWVM